MEQCTVSICVWKQEHCKTKLTQKNTYCKFSRECSHASYRTNQYYGLTQSKDNLWALRHLHWWDIVQHRFALLSIFVSFQSINCVSISLIHSRIIFVDVAAIMGKSENGETSSLTNNTYSVYNVIAYIRPTCCSSPVQRRIIFSLSKQKLKIIEPWNSRTNRNCFCSTLDYVIITSI